MLCQVKNAKKLINFKNNFSAKNDKKLIESFLRGNL